MNPSRSLQWRAALLSTLILLSLLGIWYAATASSGGPTGAAGLTPEQIEARIQERLAARKAKDFATSDRVRNELLEAGVVLEDTPQGTIWRRA